MNLDNTSKELQIVLGEAKTTNDCPIVTSWADSTTSAFTLGNTNIHSNGTTPVVAVASPATSTQRQVKEVRLFNADTVTHTVTLQLYDGTNTWIIAPSLVSVPANGAFVYTPDTGPNATVTSLTQTATISLTSAELLALNTTPVTIVPAPGSGNIVVIESIITTLDYGSTTYADSGTNTGLYYTNSSGLAIDSTLYNCFTAAASEIKSSFAPSLLHAQSGLLNAPVVLTGSANMTTGNGAGKVTVTYKIITP